MKKTKRQTPNTLLPVFLIVSGIVLGLAVLIWQLAQTPGSQSQQPGIDTSTGEISRISLADAKKAFDQNQAVFVDVRSSDTFQVGHIPGAVNIPLGDLETRLKELDPNQWIITYCT